MTEIQTNLQFESQKLTNNKDIIAYLAEKFPLCFSVEGEAKPLKVGLFQDLAEALKDDERVSKTQLRHALRQYTSNWRYLHGCRLGVERVDLQGNPTGALEQEHVDHAQQQLAEAKAKFAEKRAAEKAASPKPTKKRPMRKPADKADKMARKSAKSKTTERQPKVELKALDVASLQKGKQVKVKVGDSAKSAVILEIVKESARVELDNGLVLTVTADRLFA
ncbi:RNA chaperone ProQ [Pasteurella bettyae]|uniref:RNA chaperone ProQ n=1 Tax=Pasteurella bettyae CCUG 2042 TaxID=1095749 RepID=I3DAT9_9PAST|nr:RNA chaperone ProQ [Pasteurella bettyae]EIJ68832.1 ProP effector [Pasteurella bettyae CCUG 2042]SUB20899.1 putative solute/DNA competence effector [Pasteurella bettyae]